MSLDYRHKRINKITKLWNLKKIHPLITTYAMEKNFFESFKFNIKLYISKALNLQFVQNDSLFIKNNVKY